MCRRSEAKAEVYILCGLLAEAVPKRPRRQRGGEPREADGRTMHAVQGLAPGTERQLPFSAQRVLLALLDHLRLHGHVGRGVPVQVAVHTGSRAGCPLQWYVDA